MNIRKAGIVGVSTLALAGVCLSGTVAANAATDNATIKSTTSTTTADAYTITGNHFTDGADATITLKGSTINYTSTTKKTVNDDGQVNYTFAPTRAGVYTVTIKADGETATKKITYGSSYDHAITVSSNNTDDKTVKITGTAAANSTVKVVVSKNGEKLVTKTVAVDASGDYSTYYYGASKHGSYKVTTTYVASSTGYGVSTATDHFYRS